MLAVLVVLALGAMALLRIPAVQDRLVGAAIGRMVASQPNELFEKDALRALACGTAEAIACAARPGLRRRSGSPRARAASA